MTAPLFITADRSLLDELHRLAAAAGVTPDVATDPEAGLRAWLSAPLVVVGRDVAEGLAGLGPSRRDDVFVVAWGRPDPAAFDAALRLGARELVTLPDPEGWLARSLVDLVDPAARGLTIGVVGGSGGSGASVLACALGQVAGESGRALVLDTDPLGPGLDRLLGVDDRPGARWADLMDSVGRLNGGVLRDAVPSRAGVGVLTWAPGRAAPPSLALAREALAAGQRGHDTVVVDLPRSTDPVTVEFVSRVDVLLVVSTPTLTGIAATARWCASFPGSRRMLVLRGNPADTRPAVDALVKVTDVPTVLCMASQRRVDEAIDLGLGPVRSGRGPLRRTAREVLDLCVGPVTLW